MSWCLFELKLSLMPSILKKVKKNKENNQAIFFSLGTWATFAWSSFRQRTPKCSVGGWMVPLRSLLKLNPKIIHQLLCCRPRRGNPPWCIAEWGPLKPHSAMFDRAGVQTWCLALSHHGSAWHIQTSPRWFPGGRGWFGRGAWLCDGVPTGTADGGRGEGETDPVPGLSRVQGSQQRRREPAATFKLSPKKSSVGPPPAKSKTWSSRWRHRACTIWAGVLDVTDLCLW